MAPSLRNLPAADRAVVDLTKVTDYLLNASHPDNGGKARFFESFGFPATEPTRLVVALKDLAASGEVVLQVASAHGTKYVVDGHLGSPGGRRPFVRAIWIVDKGQDLPAS